MSDQKDDVIITIYRALRDSINKNIKDVRINNTESIIYLSLKGEAVPYLDRGVEDNKKVFDDTVWEISKDGIKGQGQLNDPVKSKSWIQKIFNFK